MDPDFSCASKSASVSGASPRPVPAAIGVHLGRLAGFVHTLSAPPAQGRDRRTIDFVSDCVQLKTDADVYNEMNRGKELEIQLVLDFTDDVAERRIQLHSAT
jgi:hypothetical protein